MLQVLDEGTLSDSHGRVIDFKNTVIIMTSNIGIDELYNNNNNNNTNNKGGVHGGDAEDTTAVRRVKAKELLSRHFPPEFINRIDEVIPFAPLSIDSIRAICKIQLKKVTSLLSDKSIVIEISDDAESWLSQTGYDSIYGARPLKRLIQSKLLNPLATYILENKITENSSVVCSAGDLKKEGYSCLSSSEESSELRFFVKSS